MFIFSPIAGSNVAKQRAYSALFQQIISARATIFTSSLIISEYINRSLRLHFNLWRKSPECRVLSPDFKKDFRPTKKCSEVLMATLSSVTDILKKAERRPDDFNAIDINKILSSKDIDFNDAYYAELCHRNKLILVTDDQDFFNIDTPVHILTY